MIKNNILFAMGSLAGGYIAAIQEATAGGDPAQLRNNVVYGFGAGTAFVYQDQVAAAGNCPGFPSYNCYLAEGDLNDETKTTQDASATNTATGNLLGNPAFEDVNGVDDQLQTLFDANGVLENKWWLAAGSTVKASGIDGSAVGEAFGFTDDYAGTARTGNGTTGWSIGAYEID
jgi:hypothetical protein